MTYCIHWFSDVEPTKYSWDKSHLIIIYVYVAGCSLPIFYCLCWIFLHFPLAFFPVCSYVAWNSFYLLWFSLKLGGNSRICSIVSYFLPWKQDSSESSILRSVNYEVSSVAGGNWLYSQPHENSKHRVPELGGKVLSLALASFFICMYWLVWICERDPPQISIIFSLCRFFFFGALS